MIINVHGFGSQGANTKYAWLKTVYPNEEICSQTFDYRAVPPESILSYYAGKVEDGLNRGEAVKIVGTSWGGFFAYCLNAMFPSCPTILLNPLLNPHLAGGFLVIDVDILRPYAEILGKYMLRHSDKCHAIIGSLDEVIAHRFLTVPIFEASNLHTLNLMHDFDISREPEVQAVIIRHFSEN